ncbi:hypothetical protein [Cognatilysobacter segetis]|uniref:hypothetical protein n=1 Tax=Cognatilysobacter segetis TaxID=2492394 RepID=UPI00105EC91F|nr:hypothetical protein [Lysobacter segetis]
MKVQFEPGRIRLRVSGDEFRALRVYGTLVASIDWPGGGWRVEVARGDAPPQATGTTLRVTFGADEIAGLEARLPARDGLKRRLELPDGAVDVLLEVDLHDGRRRPR